MRMAILAIPLLSGLAAPVHAETSIEFARLGKSIWPYFECAVAASVMKDDQAQARNFKAGYENGKTFIEALRSGKVDEKDIRATVAIGITLRLQGPNADFILGRVWGGVADEFYKVMGRECDSCILDDGLKKNWAAERYRKMNCDLLK